jgi:hypothetical protein
LQGDAYIRSHFHIDPHGLQVSQWAELYAEALYIEKTRLNNLAELLAGMAKALFGKKSK